MSNLKKLAGVKTSQIMHNNEDVRVNVSDAPQKTGRQKGKNLKAKVIQIAKAVKRIPFYVWIWEKAGEAWDWICEHAETFLEIIS